MILDNTISEIIVQVQKDFHTRFNKDLDFDKVVEVVDIQLSATSFAFTRCVPIYWKGFLKFIWTNKRQRNLDKNKLFSTINNPDLNLNERELEYFNYLAKVESHSKYKDLERLNLTSKGLTVEEATALPTKSIQFLTFKPLIRNKKR